MEHAHAARGHAGSIFIHSRCESEEPKSRWGHQSEQFAGLIQGRCSDKFRRGTKHFRLYRKPHFPAPRTRFFKTTSRCVSRTKYT